MKDRGVIKNRRQGGLWRLCPAVRLSANSGEERTLQKEKPGFYGMRETKKIKD